MSISAMLLLGFEVIILLYFMAIKHNKSFRNKIFQMKRNFTEKHRLRIEVKEPEVKPISFKILFGFMALTFFLTGKMIAIILLVGIAFIIPKLKSSFERYEEIFADRNPSLTKYNFYLFFLLVVEIMIMILGIFIIK